MAGSWSGCGCKAHQSADLSGRFFCHVWLISTRDFRKCGGAIGPSSMNYLVGWTRTSGINSLKCLEVDRSNHVFLLSMWDVAEPLVMSDDVERVWRWGFDVVILSSVITSSRQVREHQASGPFDFSFLCSHVIKCDCSLAFVPNHGVSWQLETPREIRVWHRFHVTALRFSWNRQSSAKCLLFENRLFTLCRYARLYQNNIHLQCNIFIKVIPLPETDPSCHALWSDPFAMIYSSLSFSKSPILCSSLDMGPRIILSFLMCCWSPELMELSRMLACPKYCSFAVWRRVWVVLKVRLLAVSSTQAKSGRSAGRHAARIPTLVSTLTIS